MRTHDPAHQDNGRVSGPSRNTNDSRRRIFRPESKSRIIEQIARCEQTKNRQVTLRKDLQIHDNRNKHIVTTCREINDIHWIPAGNVEREVPLRVVMDFKDGKLITAASIMCENADGVTSGFIMRDSSETASVGVHTCNSRYSMATETRCTTTPWLYTSSRLSYSSYATDSRDPRVVPAEGGNQPTRQEGWPAEADEQESRRSVKWWEREVKVCL